MQQKISFKDSGGSKVVGVLSEPEGVKEKRVVILCHGFGSNMNTKTFPLLEQELARGGISSLRFDFFGHGESEGRFEDITVSRAVDDILCAIGFLEKRLYRKIGLLGSSFGGISSIMAASKTAKLSFLVLKSPVSDYEEEEIKALGREGVKLWKEEGYALIEGKRVNYSFFEDFRNNNGYKAAKRIKIPTLIVHGDDDECVPIEQSIKTSKTIKDCKLHIVRGADHRYTTPEHFEEMVSTIKEFILKNFCA